MTMTIEQHEADEVKAATEALVKERRAYDAVRRDHSEAMENAGRFLTGEEYDRAVEEADAERDRRYAELDRDTE